MPPERRARSGRAFVSAGFPVALTLLANVPGRRVYAANEAMHGRPGWQFLCAGLLGDLLYVGPALFLAFVVPLGLGALVERRWPKARALGVARIVSVALAAPIVVLAWMFSVGAIESKLERGLYPTYLELKVALASSSFVVGSLPTLLLDRYRYASVIVLFASAGLLYVHQRASRRGIRSLTEVLGFALGALVLFLAGAELVHRGRVLFPRTGGYLETRSPIETVALGTMPSRDHAALTDGMRQLFAAHEYANEEKRAGLQILGFPEASAARLQAFEHDEPCSSPHPLARPLDRDPKEGASNADALLGDLEHLSSALFEGRAQPPIVWQIAMESFRADDIHALNPLAPAELTPVMNGLYEDRTHTLAFRRAFQGGFRTAQSLSALFCGVGSLPFNVAVARDMGHFPLRCLSDVLFDAGIEPRAYYASDLAYDSMLEFFRYHGVEAMQAADLPQGLPVGSWRGVSDRALYEQVIAHAEARAAAGEVPCTIQFRAHAQRALAVLGSPPTCRRPWRRASSRRARRARGRGRTTARASVSLRTPITRSGNSWLGSRRLRSRAAASWCSRPTTRRARSASGRAPPRRRAARTFRTWCGRARGGSRSGRRPRRWSRRSSPSCTIAQGPRCSRSRTRRPS